MYAVAGNQEDTTILGYGGPQQLAAAAAAAAAAVAAAAAAAGADPSLSVAADDPAAFTVPFHR
jgi:hypothetical protein